MEIKREMDSVLKAFEAVDNIIAKAEAERDARELAEVEEILAFQRKLNSKFNIVKSVIDDNQSVFDAVYFSRDPYYVIVSEKTIPLDNIIKFEYEKKIKHYTDTVTKQPGAISSAVVGGVIAGGPGAIVSAVATPKVSNSTTAVIEKITGLTLYLSDYRQPLYTFHGSERYLKQIYATLVAMKNMSGQ